MQRDPLELPSRDTPTEEIGPALEGALREWILHALQSRDDFAKRVALRLGIGPRFSFGGSDWAWGLWECDRGELLRVVNATLQLAPVGFDGPEVPVGNLRTILEDAGSMYAVDPDDDLWAQPRLVRRTDPMQRVAHRQAMADAPTEARRHLSEAWEAAFGIEPDPDKAYASAVKAVEDVAIPVICSTAKKPTLGTVLLILTGARTSPTTWRIVIPDQAGDPAPVEVVQNMVRTLWHGHRSRHAGAASSRANTVDEARAAVQLSVLLVGWFSTGVVRQIP